MKHAKENEEIIKISTISYLNSLLVRIHKLQHQLNGQFPSFVNDDLCLMHPDVPEDVASQLERLKSEFRDEYMKALKRFKSDE